MSRIGRMPIAIPAGVTVDIAENNQVTVKGPKGTLERVLPAEMTITKEGEEVKVTRPNDLKKMKSLQTISDLNLSIPKASDSTTSTSEYLSITSPGRKSASPNIRRQAEVSTVSNLYSTAALTLSSIKTPFRSVKYPPIATAEMAIIIKKTSPKCSWIFFIPVLLVFEKKPFSPAKMASEILLLIFKINTADHVTVDDLCPLFRCLDLHPLRIHVHQFSFDTTHIIK